MIRLYLTDDFEQGYVDKLAPILRKYLGDLHWAVGTMLYCRKLDNAVSSSRLKMLQFVISSIEGNRPEYHIDKFTETLLEDTLKKYSKKVKQKDEKELNKVFLMLEALKDGSQTVLENLLRCPADQLLVFTEALFTRFGVMASGYRDLFRYVFDYKDRTTIANAVKNYFYDNSILESCPYCNLKTIKIIREKNKVRVVDGWVLDHFFDKASYPMICYSLYNLVPTDTTCNGPFNKGQNQVTDLFHVNPHVEAFGKNVHFCFVPHPLDSEKKVIRLEVLIPKGDAFRLKLLGNEDNSKEDSTRGNLKLFNLVERYEHDEHAFHLAKVMVRELAKINAGEESYQDFFAAMQGLDREGHYREWYQEHLFGMFNEQDFQYRPYSRCLRDIHDTWYDENLEALMLPVVKNLQKK